MATTEEPEKREITIYGLISHYGSIRAKNCANCLYQSLPQLYNKPKVFLLYDLDFKTKLASLRNEAEKINRRIWSIRYPVLVFFRNRYIGDHQALIKYAMRAHKLIPDFPQEALFPDFKTLLPQKVGKKYVYLDVRFGTLTGKMVFELHVDKCPQSCKFFISLCSLKSIRKWGKIEQYRSESYIGSNFRRIYGRALVQGGKIEGSKAKIDPENYIIKHDQRGILSFAYSKEGCNTSEFCITFKDNPWMDGMNVAFGQLIFGEHILAAIEKVPTYYQSPIINIDIIGAGVIRSVSKDSQTQLEKYVDREKKRINIQFTEMERKRIEDIKKLESVVKNYVSTARKEEKIEYECHLLKPKEIYIEEEWSGEAMGEHKKKYSEIEYPFEMYEGEGEKYDKKEIEWLYEEEYKKILTEKKSKEEEIEEQEIEEWMISASQLIQESAYTIKPKQKTEEEGKVGLIKKILKEEFTLEEVMEKVKEADRISKRQFMVDLILSILKNVEKDVPRSPIPEYVTDTLDIRDELSVRLDQNKYYKGLYSLPNQIQYELIRTFQNITPEDFTTLHSAVVDILTESEISEKDIEKVMSEIGSEGVLSGILLAVWNTAFYLDKENLRQLTQEMIDDFIITMKTQESSSMTFIHEQTKEYKPTKDRFAPSKISMPSIVQKHSTSKLTSDIILEEEQSSWIDVINDEVEVNDEIEFVADEQSFTEL